MILFYFILFYFILWRQEAPHHLAPLMGACHEHKTLILANACYKLTLLKTFIANS